MQTSQQKSTRCRGILVFAAALGFLAAFPFQSDATDLRGQVQVRLPQGAIVPRPEALVELFPTGYSGRAPYATTTEHDGLYYFHSVAPGSYQVWVNRGIGPYVVQVLPVQNQDIPPILTH